MAARRRERSLWWGLAGRIGGWRRWRGKGRGDLLVPPVYRRRGLAGLLEQYTIVVSTDDNMLHLHTQLLALFPHHFSISPKTPPPPHHGIYTPLTSNKSTQYAIALAELKSPLLITLPRLRCTNVSCGSTSSACVSVIQLSEHPTQRICALLSPVLGIRSSGTGRME